MLCLTGPEVGQIKMYARLVSLGEIFSVKFVLAFATIDVKINAVSGLAGLGRNSNKSSIRSSLIILANIKLISGQQQEGIEPRMAIGNLIAPRTAKAPKNTTSS
jgi:hypothetical protein